MKICWDNLEKLRCNKNGNFVLTSKKGSIYYERDACLECKDPYIGTKHNNFCSHECAIKSDITKNKIRILSSGSNNHMYGKHMSSDTKEKISNSNKGKIFTNTHKLNLSKARKGKVHSEETKQKLSMYRKERSSNWKGGVRDSNTPLYNTYAHQLEPMEQCRRNLDDPNVLEVKCVYCGKWHVPKTYNVSNRIRFGINGHDTHRFYCSSACKQECPMFGKQKHYKGRRGYNSREVQPELRQLVFVRDK
jgi:hypothetical protein